MRVPLRCTPLTSRVRWLAQLATRLGLKSPALRFRFRTLIEATTPRLNAIRPYPGYTAINMVAPWFNANYNSLQVFARKQFKGDSQASFSYTYSKNLTNNQTDNSTAPQNSYNFQAEYGRAPQDRRHVFSANFVY